MSYQPSPQSGGFTSISQRKPRWDEKIPYFDLPKDGQWYLYRFYGPIFLTAQHWFETKNGKRFPMLCNNYDRATQTFSHPGGCAVEEEIDYKNSPIKKIKDLQPRQGGVAHAIVRSIQKQGSVDPNWRPWRPVRLPMSVMISIKALTPRNVHIIEGKEQVVDVTDPHYGRDIAIMYDPNAGNPNQRYMVTFDSHTPMNPVEMQYMNEMIQWEKIIQYPTKEDIKQALQINGYYQLMNGGGAAIAVGQGVHEQVLQGVPQPPAYQMATINPGAAAPVQGYQPQQMAPMPAPAPAWQPQAAPAYAPQPQAAPAYTPQPQMAPAPTYAPPVPQAAPAYAPQPAPAPGGGFGTVVNHQTAAPPQAAAPVMSAPAPTLAPVVALAPAIMPQPQAAPMMAAPAPTLAPAPVSLNTATAPVSSEKKFVYPGQPSGLNSAQFQQVIAGFAQTQAAGHDRMLPLKSWDKDDMEGMQVQACFGNYKGDPICLRCPTRRYCLTY